MGNGNHDDLKGISTKWIIKKKKYFKQNGNKDVSNTGKRQGMMDMKEKAYIGNKAVLMHIQQQGLAVQCMMLGNRWDCSYSDFQNCFNVYNFREFCIISL